MLRAAARFGNASPRRDAARPTDGEAMAKVKRVLVMKFGALGDVVQALGAFAQIRAAHPGAEITFLTTPPYAEFARASGLFDHVETDGRPKGLKAHLALFGRLRRARYDRVYDLQTSGRSKNYIYAFWPRPPEWSGISPGASHRQTRPDRNALHNLDRMADQLYVAGIAPPLGPGEARAPDLGWAGRIARGERASTAERFGLRPPFALLVPGASPVKPEKFWPAPAYGRLAELLIERGLQVAVVGAPAEAPLAAAIRAAAPGAVDLTGATSLFDLAGLGEEAALCVGNDTGPTHLIANAGAPGLMLMSRVTDPNHCAPRKAMQVLKLDDLGVLSAEAVLDALQAQLGDGLGGQPG
ncbi:MAG: glycosyltransferase family 9 protein [Caulobacteraceae bacterium]|nr:glycosyltransferase family 9 protein [Caulobacteraceae bacterium]